MSTKQRRRASGVIAARADAAHFAEAVVAVLRDAVGAKARAAEVGG